MLIGDGVTPGNEGRGYVLRRIMRRAIRNMRLLGATGPVVAELVDVVINDDGPAVPGAGHRPQAHRDRRPRRGGRLPQGPQGRHQHPRHRRHRDQGRRRHGPRRRQGVPAPRHLGLPDRPHPGDGRRAGPLRGRGRLPPPDEGAAGPRQGRRQGQEDRPRRPVRLPRGRRHAPAPPSSPATPPPRASRPSSACSSTASPSPAATEGDEVEVVLDRTPFYAEGGGQLADQGRIQLDTGAVIEVRDVQQPVPGVSVHKGSVQVGEVTVGASAYAAIDITPPPRHRPRPQRHPPHPPGAARRPRPDGRPGRFGELARPLPLRLRLARRRPRHGPHRRRAEDQRGARPRTRRPAPRS